jgi:hypothetical protein
VKRDWGLAQRESAPPELPGVRSRLLLAVSRRVRAPGADQSFRRIARVIAGCFRRASDLCGRFDEDQIAAD